MPGPHRLGAAVGSVLVGASLAACGLLPMGPQVECVDVDPATCRRTADRLIATKSSERPGHRIATLTIRGEEGSYDLVWDDGAGESMIVD
jgi:hypothetical protein